MCKIFNLKPKDIKDLNLKLEGKLPVNRDELLALVNSWGRDSWFYSFDKNNKDIIIKNFKIKEKFDLSKLDVSQITNFNSIFKYSYFNNDINSWDVSNAIFMNQMFHFASNFNSPLDKWNVSNVIYMDYMFKSAISFNQNLSTWNVSKVEDIKYMFANAESFNQPIFWDLSKVKHCDSIFIDAKAFKNRFNHGYNLPRDTNEIKYWINEKKDFMEAIYIKDNKSNELNKFILNISLENKSFIEKTFIKLKFYRKEYENRNI